jgi:hypothetical protein
VRHARSSLPHPQNPETPPPPPLQDAARRIKEGLTSLGHDKAAMPPPAQQKVRRLMQDFGALLQDYKAAQKLAAEREATSLPRAPAAGAAAAAAVAAAEAGGGGGREAELERQGLLQQQAMEEARLLGNAMEFNESLIEERDQGIQGAPRWGRWGRGAGAEAGAVAHASGGGAPLAPPSP